MSHDIRYFDIRREDAIVGVLSVLLLDIVGVFSGVVVAVVVGQGNLSCAHLTPPNPLPLLQLGVEHSRAAQPGRQLPVPRRRLCAGGCRHAGGGRGFLQVRKQRWRQWPAGFCVPEGRLWLLADWGEGRWRVGAFVRGLCNFFAVPCLPPVFSLLLVGHVLCTLLCLEGANAR